MALDILLKDLKVFAQSNKELYKEMTQLLTLDDFRYVDVMCFAYLAFIILWLLRSVQRNISFFSFESGFQ